MLVRGELIGPDITFKLGYVSTLKLKNVFFLSARALYNTHQFLPSYGKSLFRWHQIALNYKRLYFSVETESILLQQIYSRDCFLLIPMHS